MSMKGSSSVDPGEWHVASLGTVLLFQNKGFTVKAPQSTICSHVPTKMSNTTSTHEGCVCYTHSLGCPQIRAVGEHPDGPIHLPQPVKLRFWGVAAKLRIFWVGWGWGPELHFVCSCRATSLGSQPYSIPGHGGFLPPEGHQAGPSGARGVRDRPRLPPALHPADARPARQRPGPAPRRHHQRPLPERRTGGAAAPATPGAGPAAARGAAKPPRCRRRRRVAPAAGGCGPPVPALPGHPERARDEPDGAPGPGPLVQQRPGAGGAHGHGRPRGVQRPVPRRPGPALLAAGAAELRAVLPAPPREPSAVPPAPPGPVVLRGQRAVRRGGGRGVRRRAGAAAAHGAALGGFRHRTSPAASDGCGPPAAAGAPAVRVPVVRAPRNDGGRVWPPLRPGHPFDPLRQWDRHCPDALLLAASQAHGPRGAFRGLAAVLRLPQPKPGLLVPLRSRGVRCRGGAPEGGGGLLAAHLPPHPPAVRAALPRGAPRGRGPGFEGGCRRLCVRPGRRCARGVGRVHADPL